MILAVQQNLNRKWKNSWSQFEQNGFYLINNPKQSIKMFYKNVVYVFFCIRILKFVSIKSFKKIYKQDSVLSPRFVALSILYFIFKSCC